MRDDERGINLTPLDPLEEHGHVFVHMRLAHLQRQAFMLPASVPVWTAGSGVTAVRAHPRMIPGPDVSAARRDAVEMRVALAMETLSSWTGGPMWDAALRSFVGAARGRCASWQDLQATAADVTGLTFRGSSIRCSPRIATSTTVWNS